MPSRVPVVFPASKWKMAELAVCMARGGWCWCCLVLPVLVLLLLDPSLPQFPPPWIPSSVLRTIEVSASTRSDARVPPGPSLPSLSQVLAHAPEAPRLLLCTPHAADAAAAVSWPTIVPMLAAGEAVHARLRLLLRCITLYSTHKRAVRRRGVSFHASASPTGNRFRCGRRLAGWVSPRHKRGTSLCPEQRIRGTALQNLANYQSTGVRGADELSPPETAGCPVLSSRVHASSMESPSPGGDGSMTRPCSTAFAGWPVFQKPTTHHPRRRLQRRESLSCGS